MKYNPLQIILLIICCMLCFTSCGSDSIYAPDSGSGVEMSFDVAPESRAITTNIDEFAVYGDMKFISGTVNPVVIFDRTSVVNRDGAWCYDGIQYWLPNHEHSFVAISPSSALESEVSPQYSDSKLSITHTMPTYSGKEMQDTQDKTDLIDIVAATHRRLYLEGDNMEKISLRFSHVLSMINFSPMFDDKTVKEGHYIKFHKIEISGLKKKAKLSVTPASRLENPQTDDRLIEFTEHDGNDNLTIAFTAPKAIQNGQKVNLFDDNDAIIMLPQQFDSSSEAIIRFTYSFNDDYENRREGQISLVGQEWKPGASYNYSFTVDKIGLNFETATIEEWKEQSIPDIGWTVE